MTTELEPCPACGALPCDWVNNPHAPPIGAETVLVPVEPTEAMIAAGNDCVPRNAIAYPEDIWSAMLAASSEARKG